MVERAQQSTAPVLLYTGVFAGWFVVEFFLRAQGIRYQYVGDRDLEQFQFGPEHRLFFFPPGHCFGRVPKWALGRGPATERLRTAIANGLNYLGISAGAFATLSTPSWPIDLDLGLCTAQHRWPGETGAGTQFLTVQADEALTARAGLPNSKLRVWYHNSPILVRHHPPRCRARVIFTPTRGERRVARGKFLAGKHLTGVPAVSECSFGKGRVQLCSIHIEMGDLSIGEWQAHMRQWLADHLEAQEGMDSMEPGNRGHRLFMRTRGGRWMRPVRESRGWRLLRAMVDELLEPQ